MLRPTPSAQTEVVTIPYGTCTITVKANGGTVDIFMLHQWVDGGAGDVWVPAVAQIAADGATALFPGPNARLKIVPAGGATWTVHAPGL